MSRRLLGQLTTASRGIMAVARVRTNGFCCPLCLRFLPVTCAADAHAPAKRLGGRPVTFLCTACNGYLGFSYEAGAAQIVTLVRAQAEGKPTTLRGSVSAPDGPHLFVETTFGPSETIEGAAPGEPPLRHHDLNVRHLRPNPEVISRFKAAQERTGGRMNIRWESPADADLKLSLLSPGPIWRCSRALATQSSSAQQVASPAKRCSRARIDGLSPAFIFSLGSFDGVLTPPRTRPALLTTLAKRVARARRAAACQSTRVVRLVFVAREDLHDLISASAASWPAPGRGTYPRVGKRRLPRKRRVRIRLRGLPVAGSSLRAPGRTGQRRQRTCRWSP